MGWTTLCRIAEIPLDSGKYVEIDGYRLAVFRDGGRLFVMDDACPHAGASLSGGHVNNGHAVCPLHGWAFRLTDGQMSAGSYCQVATYKTRTANRADGEAMLQADLPIP